jgi:HD superfamily phosphohydrolase
MRLYRDPVHGDILLSPLACAILDTPEFQRLGRVMQLGFAHLVFRGATHTRLAHSIGTCWVSLQMLRHILANHKRLHLPTPVVLRDDAGAASSGCLGPDALAEIVSIAALLHDITHIPFGHTLEDELQDVYQKHDALDSPRLWWLLFDRRSGLASVFCRPEPYVSGLDNRTLRWLVYLVLAFREDDDGEAVRGFPALLAEARERAGSRGGDADDGCRTFGEFLGEAGRQFERLSAAGLMHPFMADIVSGAVSADLLDYLARDLYFTGLEGGYDRRLLHYFFIGRDARGGADRLAIDVLNPRGYARIDLTTEVMNLMRLRYSMAERVYYHKTKVAASAMLARGLLGHNLPADSNPYDNAESVLCPEMSDEEMIRRLTHASCAGSGDAPDVLSADEARDLGRAIFHRRLCTPAVVLTEAAVRDAGGAHGVVEQLRGRPGGRLRLATIESRLAAMTGIGRHGALVYCPPIKMQAKAITTPVRFEKNKIVPLAHHPEFRDEADLLNRKYRALWKVFVFVDPRVLEVPGLARRMAERFCSDLGLPASKAAEVLVPANGDPAGESDDR